MVWFVLLTPLALLGLVLLLAAIERRLFGDPLDLRLRSLGTPADSHGRQLVQPSRDGASVDPGVRTRPSQSPPLDFIARRRGGRMIRFTGRNHVVRPAGSVLPAPDAVPRPTVRPKADLDVDRLLPDTVFTTVSGECLRCGGDLSRGFAAARDSVGEDEGGLVCPSCEWLDDAERESARPTMTSDTMTTDTAATPQADADS